MLIDKNCIMVLVALDKALNSSGYEIIDKVEFLATLDTILTIEGLNFALSEISASGYIKMKFNDKEEICLAMTELGRQSVDQLEKLKLKELSAKAVVGKNSSGNMVITTIDDSPIYDTPQEIAPIEEVVTEEIQNLPIVVEQVKKKRKPAGRVATFFYGACGGVFGSGIVVGIMSILVHLGIIL